MFQPSVPKAVPIHIFCFLSSFCVRGILLALLSQHESTWVTQRSGGVETNFWIRAAVGGFETSCNISNLYLHVFLRLGPLRNSEDKFVSWKSVGGKWDLTHLQKASFIKSTAVHLLSSCVSYRRGVSSAPEIAVQQVVMTITAVKRKHWACISNKQVKMTS